MNQEEAPTRPGQRSTWSCCLVTALGMFVVVTVLALGIRWGFQWQRNREIKERWERGVANVEAGQTTCLIWPEPRFLEEFVTQQPETAAKVTDVQMFMGKASDERFRFLRQFPRLKAIYLYEIWGADTLMKNISGMESLTQLSFSETPLSEEGIAALASFPNLKRLYIDYYWKETDLRQLKGHPSLEELVLDQVSITKEWIATMADLPKLREVKLEGCSLTEAELSEFEKAVPNAKIRRSR